MATRVKFGRRVEPRRMCCAVAIVLAVVVFFSGCTVSSPDVIRPNLIQSDFPPLEQCHNHGLQLGLEGVITEAALNNAVEEHRLAVALADITDTSAPRFAGVNSYDMMYAASLPKIAILFALFKRIEEGDIHWDDKTRDRAERMIRFSSNSAASELFHQIGPQYVGRLMLNPSYRLYESERGGGLWVGKEYGQGAAWQREPLMNLSHAATPFSVVNFYYLLETGRLVSPEWSRHMKDTLADSALNHKFIRGLASCAPGSRIYRKSGSWQTFHSDSVLVEYGGRRYIAAALVNDKDGPRMLEDLIVRISALVLQQA